MGHLTEDLKGILEEDRIATDAFERVLYGHDLVSLPPLLAKFYKSMPDVVVRPGNAEQIAAVVRLAHTGKTPIIPIGASTSPTGGSMPVFGGIAMDISGMDRILGLEDGGSTVQVEPGVIWEHLERYLAGQGLALNTYPTSAPSSTVGGWVAGSGLGYGVGGVGVGSSKYGPVAENVTSLQMVLPSGEAINIPSGEFSVSDFIGTDGILGVITRIALKVRRQPAVIKNCAFQFSEAPDLCEAIESLSQSVRVYFSEFEDRTLNAMKAAADIPAHGAGNVLSVTLDGDEESVSSDLAKLRQIVREHKGQSLGEALGEEIWKERFNPLQIKRGGPSLLSSEINIATGRLKEALDGLARIGEKHRVQVGSLGILLKGSVNLLPMVLNDERKRLGYTLSVSIIRAFNDLALELGGTPYGVGLFNAFYSREIHGARLQKLKRLKKTLDPQDIMNPGKSMKHMTRYGIALPRSVYAATMRSFGMLERLGVGRS
jgi:glycolate oxidase